MPRRAKHPAPIDLFIEHLTRMDGPMPEPMVTFVDDFDGSVKPIKPELAQQRIEHARVITDYKLRMREVKIEAERKALATLERQRKLTEEIFKRKMGLLPNEPTLAHNQTKLRNDLVLSVRKPIPPWRRM